LEARLLAESELVREMHGYHTSTPASDSFDEATGDSPGHEYREKQHPLWHANTLH